MEPFVSTVRQAALPFAPVKSQSTEEHIPKSTSSLRTFDVDVDAKPAFKPLPGFSAWAAEALFCLAFWMQLSEVWSAIWYIPMNEMKISGYEAFLILLILPAFVHKPAAQSMLKKYPSIRQLSFTGLLAPIMPFQHLQIVICVVGTAVGACFIMLDILTLPPAGRMRVAVSMQLGLILSMILRVFDASLNPVMHYPGLTVIMLVFATSLAWTYMSEDRHSNHRPNSINHLKAEPKIRSPVSAVLAGLGLGALLFNSHALLTQAGVWARWISIKPFPASAVLIAVILLAFDLQLFGSVHFPSGGFAGLAFLFSFWYGSTWMQLLSAALTAACLLTEWPAAVERLNSTKHPLLSICVAMGFYALLGLGTVWAVAYPFVPFGGELLRERTLWIFGISWLVLALLPPTALSFKLSVRSELKSSIRFTLMALLVASAGWRLLRVQPPPLSEPAQEQEPIRAAVWAIHFGYDNFGRNSFDRIIHRLEETKANVIGLVETDLTRMFNGNWDVVEYLEHNMGFYTDYGPGTLNNTWGCALLSAYPIVRADRYNLPSPQGEVACLIDATIQVGDSQVDVVVTHVGNTEHVVDRELQVADSIARGRGFKARNRKALWIGYLTNAPGSPHHQGMLSAGWEDSTDSLDRWCLYIFSQSLQLRRFERFPHLDDSDTEIQFAAYALPSRTGSEPLPTIEDDPEESHPDLM